MAKEIYQELVSFRKPVSDIVIGADGQCFFRSWN